MFAYIKYWCCTFVYIQVIVIYSDKWGEILTKTAMQINAHEEIYEICVHKAPR